MPNNFVTEIQLMDMKSFDKRMTLMHYIVETVHSKFPEVASFDSELRFIEKAATGSLGF